MPTTAELLLLADQRRPRSKQVAIGFSDLGTCRRRTGYKLAMTPHVNAAGNIQAAIGTAVHDAIAGVMEDIKQDGDLVEHYVQFAGIWGKLDRYEAATRTVTDTKTTSSRWCEHIRLHGPEHSHVWQVSCYAAALIKEGTPVDKVRIEYLCRDTGEEYVWEKPLDPQDVKDALNWLRVIRDSELDMLPRDYDPDSVYCRGCPYGGMDGGICWEGHIPGRDLRSVLYVEDPDAGKWADALWEARQDGKEATARASRAKGALSAVVHPGGVPTKCGDRWLMYDTRGTLRFVSGPRPVEISP
jgi:CRISPR/Cas system-associated exonuclease Cas4 (RecB family)